MKSKTKTVGGSPVSGIGQDFNQFLQQGLSTGNFGANANAQNNGVGGAINSLLSGQIGDPSTLQGFFQGLQGNGGVGNLPNVSGNFNAPQFQGLDFSQLGQVQGNVPQLNQNVGGANLPGINFNPAQFQNVGFGNTLGGAAGLDPNGSFSQALQQIANQQLNQGVADVRERYTGQSGTPAGFAEAALRAQMAPQLTAALGNANAQERGLNLQQLGLNQNALGQLNSLNLQQGLAGNQFNQQNSQLGLQAQGLNTGNILQNQQLQNSGMLGLNSNLLQGAGLNQSAQQSNVQNQLAQMQQMLQQNQFGNQFGQQNAQFGANFGQQGQQMNAQNQMQNQSLMNQFGLGQANVGLQNQQQQLQAILGALGPLFGGLQQATGLSTPQAQTVQQPSTFSQITGGIANVAGAIAPFLPMLGAFQQAPQVSGPYQNAGQMIGSTPSAMPINPYQYMQPVLR
jgi:hypothetical protein